MSNGSCGEKVSSEPSAEAVLTQVIWEEGSKVLLEEMKCSPNISLRPGSSIKSPFWEEEGMHNPMTPVTVQMFGA